MAVILLTAYLLVCPALVAKGVASGSSQAELSWDGAEMYVFDLAVDYTPLRLPQLKWSERFGLRRKFESYSYMRRAKRYFASLPKEDFDGMKGFDCVFFGRLPFERDDDLGRPTKRLKDRPIHVDMASDLTWDDLRRSQE